MKTCYFCEEALNFSKGRLRLPSDWPYADEVVYYDENVFSIVGSSPQVSPYLLILPKRHIYSMAQMNDKEWNSFICCLEYLINKGGYNEELCIFEHGGKANESSSSIDHCHMHVIPGETGLYQNETFNTFIEMQNISNSSQINGDNYLLIGRYINGKLDIKISYDKTKGVHQYFRKVLSQKLCLPEWDWKKNPKFDIMLETLRGFKETKDKRILSK